jgi:hypothetical protein
MTEELLYPNVITITYKSTGYDHDGYCSGEEVCSDSEEPEVKIFKKTENNIHKIPFVAFYNGVIDKEKKGRRYLREYAENNSGCTSKTGSGYCKGFYQKVRAIKIEICNENSLSFQIMEADLEHHKKTKETNLFYTEKSRELELERANKIKILNQEHKEKIEKLKKENQEQEDLLPEEVLN